MNEKWVRNLHWHIKHLLDDVQVGLGGAKLEELRRLVKMMEEAINE